MVRERERESHSSVREMKNEKLTELHEADTDDSHVPEDCTDFDAFLSEAENTATRGLESGAIGAVEWTRTGR